MTHGIASAAYSGLRRSSTAPATANGNQTCVRFQNTPIGKLRRISGCIRTSRGMSCQRQIPRRRLTSVVSTTAW
jgi:hypothetical protein